MQAPLQLEALSLLGKLQEENEYLREASALLSARFNSMQTVLIEQVRLSPHTNLDLQRMLPIVKFLIISSSLVLSFDFFAQFFIQT